MKTIKSLFILTLFFCTLLTTCMSDLAKCTKGAECKKYCHSLGKGDCYEDGLCKCLTSHGEGSAPSTWKCKEVTAGECKKACDGSSTIAVKNPNAYTCDGTKLCFCRIEVKPGVVTKCDLEDDDAKICAPKDDKVKSRFCKDNKVSCDEPATCTCEDGDILNTKECIDEPYCRGVCKSAAGGGAGKKGKMCTAKENKKVCVCSGD